MSLWSRASQGANSPPGCRYSRAGDHEEKCGAANEGRNVIYVARQLGHDARLTLTRGHVIDELEDQSRIEADAAIANARLAVRMGGAAAAEFGS